MFYLFLIAVFFIAVLFIIVGSVSGVLSLLVCFLNVCVSCVKCTCVFLEHLRVTGFFFFEEPEER